MKSKPPPDPTKISRKSSGSKRRVTFVLDEELDNLLEVYCNHNHLSKNLVAEIAITEHLAQHREKIQDAIKTTERKMTEISESRGHHA